MQHTTFITSLAALIAACSSAHGALTLANGNFEGMPASDNLTDVAGWYDYDGGEFYEQTWLEGVDTPADYNFSLALAGDTHVGQAWAYQGIGTADGASMVTISFDYGSFGDSSNLRDLGVKWAIYAVTGGFVPGQNVDIDGAAGVTMLDSAMVSALQVAPGAKVGMTSVNLDVSGAGSSQLYLRVVNFTPTDNSNANGYEWIDQVSLLSVPEPSGVVLLIFGVVAVSARRRRCL